MIDISPTPWRQLPDSPSTSVYDAAGKNIAEVYRREDRTIVLGAPQTALALARIFRNSEHDCDSNTCTPDACMWAEARAALIAVGLI